MVNIDLAVVLLSIIGIACVIAFVWLLFKFIKEI